MRIAMVSEHASPLAACGDVAGGQNVYVDFLSRALVERGHEVFVFTRRDSASLPTSVTTQHGVTVVHLDAGPPQVIDKDDLFPYMHEFGGRLVTALRSVCVDVLHSHFWMSAYASQPVVARLGIPWIHTYHALGTVKRRHQYHDDRSPAARLGVEHDVLHRADAIVATCTDEVRELRAMGGDARHIDVVPCGFDTQRFRPIPDRGRPDPVRIAVVSRLVPRKGVADVITALAHVRGAELVVAGGHSPGPSLDAHERYLQDLVGRLRLQDRVRFLGAVDSAEIAAVHRSSDFFVHAPWYEPFGIAPVEAMGSGLPVIGTAVGGLLDTVVDGVTGMLVPPHDVTSLCRAMSHLADSHELRARLGRRASERAHHLYSWQIVAQRMERVYRSVVRQRRALAEVSA